MWYSHEHASKTEMEEQKLLNDVVIFVFFAHKKYCRSFTTLRLNHWCHMDYFNNVFTTFLGLEHGSSIAVYGGPESSRISSNISSFVFGRWTKVLQVWNLEYFLFFLWTIPLKLLHHMASEGLEYSAWAIWTIFIIISWWFSPSGSV